MIDTAYFSRLCFEAASNRVVRGDGINTMGEKRLHQVLKRYYEPDETRHEQKVGRHIADILREKGAPKVVVADLSRCDMAEAVEDAFRYSHMVVCAASYDADVFPPMHDFLHHLKLKNYQNRRVAIVENGSWAPTAGRVMRGMLEGMKNIEIVEPMVTIRSRMKENDLPAMELLATELLA
jgi:flavorubredoxin